ncbi:hypothetical protein [Spirosoma sp. KNUC1025]|uniref:hypothetical protein n=1 Tax=Spirosoma sp. KNUC1025 TaxID=2894082 RepID=UPI0038673105|nr:hypothetical protein LN737_05075 [Spirosoma sp. KNUC1025]
MKDFPTRTPIVIDESIVYDLIQTLNDCRKELAKAADEKERLRKELDRNRLLTEAEAQEYLRRDYHTLVYYRKMLGLSSFKIGKDRWYVKGQIDDWLASGKVSRHSR